MAITSAMCTSFKQEILEGVHDLSSATSQTFKIALYTSSATLGASTTAYSATNEVSGTGYTAAGEALTSPATSASGTTAFADFADASWTSASFTANGALIYNDTVAGDPAVAVLAFGGDKTVSSGTFTIVFPTADATDAILRIE